MAFRRHDQRHSSDNRRSLGLPLIGVIMRRPDEIRATSGARLAARQCVHVTRSAARCGRQQRRSCGPAGSARRRDLIAPNERGRYRVKVATGSTRGAVVDPDRGVCWFNGSANGVEQIDSHRIEVDSVA
jgi:hypothetical protein